MKDLAKHYNAKKHPKYISGEWSETKVYQEFLKTFEAEGHVDGIVSIEGLTDRQIDRQYRMKQSGTLRPNRETISLNTYRCLIQFSRGQHGSQCWTLKRVGRISH